MPCSIQDSLFFYTNALSPTGLTSQQVLAVPSADYYRILVAGSYRVLGQNPNINTAAYKLGIVATTDSGGQFSFSLPYGTAESHPAEPVMQWSIVLPDGRIFAGVVPSVAGPLKLDDLLTTYEWIEVNAVYTQPTTAGVLARGSATFTAASSASVVLAPPMSLASYVIKLSPSLDTVTGEIPGVAWSSKTTTGFTITTTTTYSGIVDWEVSL